MFCSNCGASNREEGRFCVNCGKPLEGRAEPPSAATPPIPGLAPPYAGPAETSGKAIASLICGLLFFIFPSAVAAIILGHLSLSAINKSAGRLAGRGMAIAGLVLGYGGVLFIPFILIIAAISIPNLLRARMAANEAFAAASLREIEIAAMRYHFQYSAYPPSLVALDGADNGAPSCEHAHLIDSALATGEGHGYLFEYVATGSQIASVQGNGGGCTTAGFETYHLSAMPITQGTTGMRSFYTDESGVIRVEQSGPASAESPTLEGSQRF